MGTQRDCQGSPCTVVVNRLAGILFLARRLRCGKASVVGAVVCLFVNDAVCLFVLFLFACLLFAFLLVFVFVFC